MPWIALFAAFSPVLVDLSIEMKQQPWGGVSLVAPILLVRAAMTETRLQTSRGSTASALIAGGILLLGVGLLTESAFISHCGLPLAAIGIASWCGAPSWRTALLTLWIMPLPAFVTVAISPGLESALANIGAWIAQTWNPDLIVSGPLAILPGGERLELSRADSGITLLWLLLELLWFARIRLGWTGRQLLQGVGCALLLGLPLQSLAIIAAFLIFAGPLPHMAGALLDPGLWLITTFAVVAWIEWLARRKTHSEASHV